MITRVPLFLLFSLFSFFSLPSITLADPSEPGDVVALPPPTAVSPSENGLSPPSQKLLEEVVALLTSKLQEMDRAYENERAIEKSYDWTGWVESSEICVQGECPANSVCKEAKITSQSGFRCRCVEGHELVDTFRKGKMCTTFSDWIPYHTFCPNDKCPRNSYCRQSTLHSKAMCNCVESYTRKEQRRGGYTCDR